MKKTYRAREARVVMAPTADTVTSTSCTHLIIGAGAVGSAAAYWLSRDPDNRVVVLEQFELMNDRNQSGDHSRIIRHSYHDTTYGHLTDAMFEAWHEVEAESGLPIYLRTGGLDIADAHGLSALEKIRATLATTGVAFEDLDSEELRRRYPQWEVGDEVVALYQEAGGLIDIRRSVSAHTALAMARGARFLPGQSVEHVSLRSGGVSVTTATDVFHADHLVVAASAWLPRLMPDLGLDFSLTLSEEQVTYFTSRHLAEFAADRFPIWIHHSAQTHYGFPVYGNAGVKIARDMRGRFIDNPGLVAGSDAAEEDVLLAFLERHLPRAAGPALTSRTCVYDMPPDRAFVLDTLPEHPHVAVFNGAGHAGKFASLAGRLLAELLTTGTTALPIDAFSLLRPALTDPSFVPVWQRTPTQATERGSVQTQVTQ